MNINRARSFKCWILFIDNIFEQFGGLLFHHTGCVPMGTNCAPLPAGLFLHSYEADPLQEIFKNKEIQLDQTIDSSFRYIDGVLSLNNSRLGEYLHFINQNELDVKDTTDNQRSTSYLDLHIEIENGRLKKTLLQT